MSSDRDVFGELLKVSVCHCPETAHTPVTSLRVLSLSGHPYRRNPAWAAIWEFGGRRFEGTNLGQVDQTINID